MPPVRWPPDALRGSAGGELRRGQDRGRLPDDRAPAIAQRWSPAAGAAHMPRWPRQPVLEAVGTDLSSCREWEGHGTAGGAAVSYWFNVLRLGHW